MDEITKASSVSAGVLPSSHEKGRMRKFIPRWIWLPVIGSVIGATVGCIYFRQLPAQFKATAQIQVNSPSEEIPTVIRSSAVLKKAVERIDLTKNKNMDGKTAEEIIETMRGANRNMLVVQLGAEGANTRIVNISVTTKDQKLSGELVTAIVDSYANQVSQNFGSSFIRLEIPTIGGFTGPYWKPYVAIGALLGFVAFSVITKIGVPKLIGLLTTGRVKVVRSVNSDSRLFSKRAIITRAPSS